jgi:glycosyltransferase involved in cell wall biosynthesis
MAKMAANPHGVEWADPLVTCLMLSLAIPQRFAFACASIAAYCQQTYIRKELVILLNGGTAAARRTLQDHVDRLTRPDIRIVEIPGALPLGRLRNISLAEAAGEIICQWDDDDLYHPERVAQQVRAILEGGHEAIFLSDVFQYFPHAQSLYWTNWAATPAGGHPGTLMARASAGINYPEAGPSSQLGEDLELALILKSRGQAGYLAALPHLFIYVSHGENSWDMDHHRNLIEKLSISTGLLRRRESAIRSGLQCFGFAQGVQVVGSSGKGFTLWGGFAKCNPSVAAILAPPSSPLDENVRIPAAPSRG